MGWLAERAEQRAASAGAVARGAQRRRARPVLRAARTIRWPRSTQPRPRQRSRSMPATATITTWSRGRLKHLARSIVARFGPRREGVRRHRAGDGKAAGAARRARLAGQAHQPRLARTSAPGCSSARSTPTLELPPDAPEADHCGTCRAVSTSARPTPSPRPTGSMRRRCISYLTIEHKGPIPHELRPLIGNRIYGCDDCLAVCPWNKFARATPHAKLRAARRSDRAASRRTGAHSTMPRSARCSPARRSSASAATASCATC